MARSTLKDQISLLQGNYHFLSIGKFLEDIVKKKDLSPYAQDTAIITGDKTQFVLNSKKIQKLLSSIHNNPSKQNILGYMVEVNAIRGVISVIKELIDTSPRFDKFLRNTLDKQYFSFEQVIRFLRNVYSHARDAKIIIKKEDFVHQKTYLKDKDINTIHFLFNYKDFIKQWKGSDTYGIEIQINFTRLKSGTPLYTAVPLHQCYLLCELCYNLSKLYNEINNKK